jgi:hypothetical protein
VGSVATSGVTNAGAGQRVPSPLLQVTAAGGDAACALAARLLPSVAGCLGGAVSMPGAALVDVDLHAGG